ncbi:MFS transporter [Streptomyces sp. NPDC005236]|uniref:MFS transporter n=1 Tax=Streptomyces sp. NPDC005236 TaxID=3157028 RepID=UPI0033BA188B
MTDTDVVPLRSAGPPAPDLRHTRRAWTVTTLLVVFMMVNFADKCVLGLAADPIRHDLGLSATEFGLANSAFFLLFSLCGGAVGLLSDRVRPRRLLLTMALVWSVAQLPMALGGGLAVLVISRIVLGAAEGPAFPVAQHSALSWFPDERRNLPGALVTVGTTLGVVVAAPGLTWVIHHHGWRSAFGVVAAAGALWAAAWVLFGREGRYASAAPGTAEPTGALARRFSREATSARRAADGGAPADVPYRRILGTRTWISVTVAYFSTYWCVALTLVWLPSYLHDGLGYATTATASLIALLWTVNGVAMLGQAGLSGWLLRRGVSSRWARARVGGITLVVSAVACLLLPSAPRGPVTVSLLVLGFGICGVMAGVAVTTVAEIVPEGRRGGALGLMNAVVTTAGLIAPALTGFMVDAQGAAGYQHAVLLAGALLLVGGLAAIILVDPARDARHLNA